MEGIFICVVSCRNEAPLRVITIGNLSDRRFLDSASLRSK